MKKLRITIILGLVALAFAMLAACGAPSLSKPQNVKITNKTVTWDAVENARGYTVELAGVKHDVRRNSYSFDGVRLEEGTYTVKVKARSNGVDYADSDWATIEYVQGYESGMVYALDDSGRSYVIQSVGTAKGDIVIDDTYNGLPVTAVSEYAFINNLDVTSVVIGKNVKTIGERAFYGCTAMTSVTIPEGVTTIADTAFQSCHSLTAAIIPDSVTSIGVSAFAYCKSLTDVSIGAGVTSIGENAFKNCGALSKIDLPAGVRTLGKEAFRNCSNLASVKINSPSLTVGESTFRACVGLESVDLGNCEMAISDNMFADCAQLGSVDIPDSVTAVGNSAFYKCAALADISIGAGVTSVGMDAFAATAAVNALESKIYVIDRWIVGTSNSNSSEEKLVGSEDLNALYEQDIIGIADYAFNTCLGLYSIQLPKAVKYIGKGAFYRGENILYAFIGDEALSVGYGAFYGCSKLLRVQLGAKVRRIESYAFAYCTNLTCEPDKFNIPDTVTSIGTYAFYKTALWNKAETAGQVGSEADGTMYVGSWFVGCTVKTMGAIKVADGTVGIADYAFAYCSLLTGVTLPESVMYLGEGAFYGCNGQIYALVGLPAMFTANIPDGITEIKPYTFYGSAIRNVTLPETVKKIGYSAFGGSALTQITVPDTVTEIDSYAFWGCTVLTQVTLSQNITEIADRAFSGCSSLQSITVPSKVTSIGERAFFRCESLAEVVFKGDDVDTIADKAFYMCTNLKSISLPAALVSIGDYAFYKCQLMTDIEFNGMLGDIGDYAFYDCQALTNLVLPDSVTSIGSSAFRNCRGLKQAVISRYVTEIGAHAFYGQKDSTVYCESPAIPSGWAGYWNSAYRPVVLGCTLDADKRYVVSVEKTDVSIYNRSAENGIGAPVRDGYEFVGWATEAGGQAVYSAAEIYGAPNGTLYAVWQERPEPEPEPEPTTPPDPAPEVTE